MAFRHSRVPPQIAADKRVGLLGIRLIVAITKHTDASAKAYPSLGTLAELADMDRRKVPGEIAKLERAGWLTRTRRGKSSTEYTVCMPDGEWLPICSWAASPERTPPAPPEMTPEIADGASNDGKVRDLKFARDGQSAPAQVTGVISQSKLVSSPEVTGDISGDDRVSPPEMTECHPPGCSNYSLTDSLNDKENVTEKRATRFPPEAILTDEWRKFALDENPGINPDRTFAKFKDHWISVPRAKGRKLDWTAAWRNWNRNESDYGKRRSGKAEYGNGFALIMAEQRAATRESDFLGTTIDHNSADD